MSGYIYVIQTREFIRLQSNVYKIGKTERSMNERLQGYAKGSEIKYHVHIPTNAHKAEKMLIHELKKIDNIKHCTDYGNEYFEGDLEYITNTIDKIAFSLEEEDKETNDEQTKIREICPLCNTYTAGRKQLIRNHLLRNTSCADETLISREKLVEMLDYSTTYIIDEYVKSLKKYETLQQENIKLQDEIKQHQRQNEIILNENKLLKHKFKFTDNV
jgi:hypothetical protein